MNGESGLDLPVSGPVGELGLVDAGVVRGDALDAQAVGAVLLEHHEPVVLGVDVAAVLGPLAHGLGAETRRGNSVKQKGKKIWSLKVRHLSSFNFNFLCHGHEKLELTGPSARSHCFYFRRNKAGELIDCGPKIHTTR